MKGSRTIEMSNIKYKKVCILGMGKMALQCAEILLHEDIEIQIYDVNKDKSLYLEAFARKWNLPYFHMSKQEIYEQMRKSVVPILLLSIVNPYIIPSDILDKDNITAVNLHHALLPKHPGRNAEAWTIYDGDEWGGISWHFMTSVVDGGDIIAQERVALTEEYTSLKLTKIQNELAIKAFERFGKLMLRGDIKGQKQEGTWSKVRYVNEKPNNGFLNLMWTTEEMSRFLRAMDYGPLNILGKSYVVYEGLEYEINKYKISRVKNQNVQSTVIEMKNNILTIHDGKRCIELVCKL